MASRLGERQAQLLYLFREEQSYVRNVLGFGAGEKVMPHLQPEVDSTLRTQGPKEEQLCAPFLNYQGNRRWGPS